ncbi:hypothetical protein [Klebsiella aerogenes]|jgi:hypothetical protein|nr:hypothetical protein [Klebsiella aerogenes]KZR48712.1 hypothetical protein A3N69_06890 [Klebsiella aerogenes]
MAITKPTRFGGFLQVGIMKFIELPERVQEQAAERLSEELQGMVTWKEDERTEKAKAIAKSVRESFIELCSEC